MDIGAPAKSADAVVDVDRQQNLSLTYCTTVQVYLRTYALYSRKQRTCALLEVLLKYVNVNSVNNNQFNNQDKLALTD